MGSKYRIKPLWDFIRRKGATAELYEGDLPTHYGARYIYSGGDMNRLVREFVESENPLFVARPGRTELKVLGEFLNSIRKRKAAFSKKWRRNINIGAGFFTPTDKMLTRFCCEMLTMFRDVDIFALFGAVRAEGIICGDYLSANCFLSDQTALFPYNSHRPWTGSLKGKKVLVVHPFTDTIVKQYERRHLLFANPDVLPEFELIPLKAVQTLANNKCEFPDWFAALEDMKARIDEVDFDVALIGAGAYGFFLAHHCKKIGKKGIQVASALQLLFGIKGKRWVKPKSGGPAPFINEHWVYPSADERPANAELVENGCYW